MLDTQANGNAALCGTFLFLTTLAVMLRFYARFKLKNAIAVDDYLIIAAWIGLIGLSALTFYGITHKFTGYPEPDDMALVDHDHVSMERVYISINSLSAWTFGTAKLSALFFLLRVFNPNNERTVFHFVSIFYIVIITSWTIIFVILPFNTCPGHSLAWSIQPNRPGGCSLIVPYYEAAAISDVILDVMILILPLPKIWTLNMAARRKLAVTGVFLVALVGLAASLTRMIIVLHLVLFGGAFNHEDRYQSNTQTGFYAVLEGGFTVLAVNLPSLWYYISGTNLDRVLRSVRSMVSLRFREEESTENPRVVENEAKPSRQILVGNREDGGSSVSNGSIWNRDRIYDGSQPLPSPDAHHADDQVHARYSADLA